MRTNGPQIIGRYPPSIQQLATIRRLTGDPDAEVRYTVRLAFLISPRVDLRRLERTFAKLANRHDALRQSFERQGDAWFVNVWSEHRTGLLVEDHGDLNDTDFHALLDRHASTVIDLLDDVLFQVVILRCGARGDVLLIRGHHANFDGHAIVILVEDWLNLLIGIPLLGQGVSHEEYLSEHSIPSPKQKLANQNYWNELLFPALPNPGLGKFGKREERPRLVYRTDTTRSIKCPLTTAEFNEIPMKVNAPSQTPFSVVLAAFADSIIELSALPGIYLQTVVDRTSRRLRNYVGCAVAFMPIRCDAANGVLLPEYTAKLSSQLKQSLAHLPSEAAGIELDFDHAVHKMGGVLRHFSCNVTVTDGRARKSAFSGGYMAEQDTPRRIGPLTLTRLAIET